MGGITVVRPSSHSDIKSGVLGGHLLRTMLRKMILIRRFEEKVEELYLKMALITGPSHLYLGMEAIATGASEALRVDDYVLATYRGHGHAVSRGAPLYRIFAELMGRIDGTCGGIGGSMHVATWTENKLMLATAIVGSNIPIAAGMGLAVKKKGEDRVVAAFFGDGAVNSGAFNEGINLAAVWKVPVIFICENNFYAMSLPHSKGISSKSIAERAASYNIPTFVADGNDPTSVYKAVLDASEICRRGEGPTFVECRTWRMKGHGIYDKAEYRTQDEVERWSEKDPVRMFESFLDKEGVVKGGELDKMRGEVEVELDEAIKKARTSPVREFSSLQGLVYPGDRN
jgi:TPP-dependent pyruvate/acetoin dehydrogenase alpha subunit